MTTITPQPRTLRPVGEMLREWRERRRLSQLDLAIQADISTRHLSFVETGRSRPTPTMIIKLTEQLDVPPAGAQLAPARRRTRARLPAARS